MRIIGNIGDINAIEYGGGFVLDHGDGHPTLVVFDPHGDSDDARVDVWTVALDRRKIVTDDDGTEYYVPLSFDPSWGRHPSTYDEWEDKHMQSIADTIGATVDELYQAVCSEDPVQRAYYYEAVAATFGWHEVCASDQPDDCRTRAELRKKWALPCYWARKRKSNPVTVYA
jgi:hypothetical protein